MTEPLIALLVKIAEQLPFATLLLIYIWFARKAEDSRETTRTANAASDAQEWRAMFQELSAASSESQEVQAETHATALAELGRHLGGKFDQLTSSHDRLTEALRARQ